MMEIILPWPDRRLHPNSRCHWAVKRKATKAARGYAATSAYLHGLCRVQWPEGRLHVWIDGYPPDRRRRDHDGFLSSLKASLDGIADALGVNDSRFVPHPWIKDEVRKGGEVRIRITADPDSMVKDEVGAKRG